MNKIEEHITPLPKNILGQLRPHFFLDFIDYPFLMVEVNQLGQLFLNYYMYGKKELTSHLLIGISNERLSLLITEEITVHQAFKNPENEFGYVVKYNNTGSVKSIGAVDSEFIKHNNPVPIDYNFDFELVESFPETDLQLKSIQRGRILVDVYLQSKELKSSLKYWAIKKFLIPFTELIRFSLLDQNSEYTARDIDSKVNLGMNKLSIGSLATTIEINYNEDLFGESKNLSDLKKMFFVLSSSDQDNLLKSLGEFRNKKIIAEYLRVLNTIIKHDASFVAKISSPNNYFEETKIDKNLARTIKKIINDKIPSIEDIEEVRGYLFELNFDKNDPTFSLRGSEDDFKFKGQIDKDLVSKIGEIEFTFIDKEYEFEIHTLYTPESSKSSEKIIRTLLNIREI